MIRILTFISLFAIAHSYVAQQDSIGLDTNAKQIPLKPKEELIRDARFNDGRMLYKHGMLGGIGIHTAGWNFWFRKISTQDWFKSSYWQIDFSTLKHPKEVKISPFEGETGYVFGKLNSLSALRASYGFQRMLFEKEEFNGVQIGYNISGGISLGILKPVFLEVEYPFITNGLNSVIEQYNPDKHDRNKIIGKAPFSYGLDKLSFAPALHLKSSMYVEYSPQYEFLRSIELGVMADIFLKEVPIMAYAKNKFLFVNLFVTWQFGKRYNNY